MKLFGWCCCCYLSYPQNWSCYSYLAKMTWQKSSVRISWIPKLNEIRLISFVPIVWEKGGHQYPASVFSLLSKVCFKVALQHLIKQFGEKKVWQVLRFTFTPFFVMMWKQHSFAFVVALHFSNLNNELQMTFYLTDYYQINVNNAAVKSYRFLQVNRQLTFQSCDTNWCQEWRIVAKKSFAWILIGVWRSSNKLISIFSQKVPLERGLTCKREEQSSMKGCCTQRSLLLYDDHHSSFLLNVGSL